MRCVKTINNPKIDKIFIIHFDVYFENNQFSIEYNQYNQYNTEYLINNQCEYFIKQWRNQTVNWGGEGAVFNNYSPKAKIDRYLTRRLHRRSLRLPARRKWGQSGYLCTTPSTAQAGADAGISWS